MWPFSKKPSVVKEIPTPAEELSETLKITEKFLNKCLKRVSFKPNKKMWLEVLDDHHYRIHSETTVLDADGSEKVVIIEGWADFATNGMAVHGATEEDIWSAAYLACLWSELHELKEWFRVDEKHWYDPHPVDGKYNQVAKSRPTEHNQQGVLNRVFNLDEQKETDSPSI